MAQAAAGGLDVHIGGGPSTVNSFLQADLIDFQHLSIVPIVLGGGVQLSDNLAGLEERFTVESTVNAGAGSGRASRWNPFHIRYPVGGC